MPDWFVNASRGTEPGIPEKCASKRHAEEKAKSYRTAGWEAWVFSEPSVDDFRSSELEESPSAQRDETVASVRFPTYLLIDKDSNYRFAADEDGKKIIAFNSKKNANSFMKHLDKTRGWSVKKIEDTKDAFMATLRFNKIKYIFVVNTIAEYCYYGDTINVTES